MFKIIPQKEIDNAIREAFEDCYYSNKFKTFKEWARGVFIVKPKLADIMEYINHVEFIKKLNQEFYERK